jgi:hypothetical protein
MLSSLKKEKNMIKFLSLMVALFISSTLQASESDRFITKVKLPSGQTAVIAEGDFEARSIGSFSVRLYDVAAAEDETTFFTAGLICSRDGIIEKVVLADVGGDQQPEIIVIVRSVGTGGYLSAHAFAFDKKSLILRTSVEGLPPKSDPVLTLRKSKKKEK